MPDLAASAAGGEFAQAATRLAGYAGVLLGWRPDEFWHATPAELGAVVTAMRPDTADAIGGQEFAALRQRFPDASSQGV